MPRSYGTTNVMPYSSAPAVGAAGDTYFNTSNKQMYVSDGTSWISISASTPSIPVGTIFAYGGSSEPSGYLFCNGAIISRTTYSDLFGVIGTSFGTGDGSTTFGLPALEGRFPLGASGLNLLGSLGGDSVHDHGLEGTGFALITMTASGSVSPYMSRVTSGVSPSWNANIQLAGGGNAQTGTQTAQTGGTTLRGTTNPKETWPPYLSLNYVIKT